MIPRQNELGLLEYLPLACPAHLQNHSPMQVWSGMELNIFSDKRCTSYSRNIVAVDVERACWSISTPDIEKTLALGIHNNLENSECPSEA